MDTIDKIYFVFTVYDFESVGSLSYDEVMLTLRSAVTGLRKFSPLNKIFSDPKNLQHVRSYSSLIFKSSGKAEDVERVGIEDFKSYCTSHPVLSSWIKVLAMFSTYSSSEEVKEESLSKPVVVQNSVKALNKAVDLERMTSTISSEEYANIVAKLPAPPKEVTSVDLPVDADSSVDESTPAIPVQPPQRLLPWMEKADLAKPEEIPGPIRADAPEDLLESAWIHGVSSKSFYYSFEQTVMVEEVETVVTFNAVLFSSANNVIMMKKNEETGWSQAVFTAHYFAISSMCVHNQKGLAATGDGPASPNVMGGGILPAACCVIVWDLTAIKNGSDMISVRMKIPVPDFGVKKVDLNSSATVLLTIQADSAQTVVLYDIPSGAPIFSRGLISPSRTSVEDACFLGTSKIFAVAGGSRGISFYVDEESGFMSKIGMKMYEERIGLVSGGKRATLKDASITKLSPFANSDELVAGTDQGHILLWSGRTCTQVRSDFRAAVTDIEYASRNGTLVAASADGVVNIYLLTASSKKTVTNKGPKVVVPRTLELSASFDILQHGVQLPSIRSISISGDVSRFLVTSHSCEIMELSATAPIQATIDATDAPPAEGEEGDEDIPKQTGKLGDDLNGGPILVGHFGSKETTTALSGIPGGTGFISCGADSLLRIWQATSEGGTANKMLKETKLDCACSKLAVSATHVAVTFDATMNLGSSNEARTGKIHIFTLPDLSFVVELTDCDGSISDMKLSADGNLLGAACTDGNIAIFSQNEGVWALKGKIVVPNSNEVAFAIDFSTDGQYLRSCYTTSLELRVFDLVTAFGNEVSVVEPAPAPVMNEDGELEPVPASPVVELMRSITWATNSCPYNWDTKGVNTVTLAKLDGAITATCFDRFNNIMVTALSNGLVSVDRVPQVVPTEGSISSPVDLARVLYAHLGKISALAFIEEGTKLVTAGAFDGAIRVWKITADTEEYEPDVEDVPGEEDAPVADEEDEEEGKAKLPVLYESGEDEDYYDDWRMKEHLSAVRIPDEVNVNKYSSAASWASSFGVNESELPKVATQALIAPAARIPNDELCLDWVYGCSTRTTRSSVKYSSEGNIVYPAGALSVVYDKLSHKQIHNMSHYDELTCLDVNLTNGFAVTGNKGTGSIFACIWKTVDGSLVRSLNCGEVNGISAIKFSDNGELIAVACQDENHTILLFRTKDGKQLGQCKGGKKKVLCLAFSASSSRSETNYNSTVRILQGGISHFRVLTFHYASRVLSSKTGGYGPGTKKSNVLAVCAVPLPLASGEEPPTGTDYLLAMSDGTIGAVSLGESKVSAFTPVHKGSVTSICVAKVKDATPEEPPIYKVLSGGVDGIIRVLDQELQPLHEFKLYGSDFNLLPIGRLRGVKSLSVDKLNRKILYATAADEIGEIDFNTGVELNAEGLLMTGHFKDQLHGMCTHPHRQECLTAGDDKTLRVWDLDKRRMITSIELQDITRAVTYSPNGQIVVAGLGGLVPGEARKRPREFNGSVVVLSYLQNKLRVVHTAADAKDAITSVIFTPDGSKLLAASLDFNIYMYDALNNFTLIQTFSSHTEGVRSIDMSADGSFSTSEGVSGQEVVVWDLNGGAAISSETQKFETLVNIASDWFVRQGVCGFTSVGVVPPNGDPSDVFCLTQSHDKLLLATGDCRGYIKLFQNPSTEYSAPYKHFTGHSPGGVSKVGFTAEDIFLVSTGRHDKTMLQWKFVKATNPPDSPALTSLAGDAGEAGQTEGNFASSFESKGVDFTRPSVSFKAATQIEVYLKSIASTTFSATKRATYCGTGEILANFGNIVTLMERGVEGTVKHKPWLLNTYNEPFTPKRVSCFEATRDGRFVVIGHGQSNLINGSKLLVLSAPSGMLITELSGHIDGGVVSATFSNDGKMIACLSGDRYHSIHVFMSPSGLWDDSSLLYTGPVSEAAITLVSFLSKSTSPEDFYDLVTAGNGAPKFFRIKGRNMVVELGVEDGDKHAITTALACLASAGRAISGEAGGEIYMWTGRKKDVLVGSHTAAITSLYCINDTDGRIVSGSSDSIKVWWADSSQLLMEFPVVSMLPDYFTKDSFVTSISTDVECKRMLLAFDSSPMVVLSCDSGSTEIVSQGHSAPITAIVASPYDESLLVTLCEDNVLRGWRLPTPSITGYAEIYDQASDGAGIPKSELCFAFPLSHRATAVDFLHNDVLLVAVADADTDGKSGAILVLKIVDDNLTVVEKLHNVGTGDILSLQVRRYSSGDSKTGITHRNCVMAGSTDGCLYVYEAPFSGTELTPSGYLLALHPVTGIDFSVDLNYARVFGPSNHGKDCNVPVTYFDFQVLPNTAATTPVSKSSQMKKQLASKVSDEATLKALATANWRTASSAAACEFKGVNFASDNSLKDISSFFANPKMSFTACADGSVQIYR